MSLRTFAQLLGLQESRAEDALHSERAARAVLSRRNFFAASGALAAGSAFSFATTPLLRPLHPFMAAMADASAEVQLGMARNLAWLQQLPFAVVMGETENQFRDRARADLRKALTDILNQSPAPLRSR